MYRNYLFQNFFDDTERFIVVGAKSFREAAELFCERYGKILHEVHEESGVVYTMLDKWLVTERG